MPLRPLATAIATATLAALAAPAARAAGPDFSACFGGTPDVVVGSAKKLRTLQINQRYLFWAGYRMDLATRAVTEGVTPGDARIWDAREAFAISGGSNDLVVRDLTTGAERVILPGQGTANYMVAVSSMALDDTYVYLSTSRQSSPDPTDNSAGLYRVRRDGSKPPERIALEPMAYQPFVADGGFVYWIDRDGLMRRKLILDAPEETIVPKSTGQPRGPLRIAGGRVYYVVAQSIWSRPADGNGPAVEEAEVGTEMIQDLVVVSPCLYFSTARSIRRARLGGDPRRSQVIAIEQNYAGNVVSDGRFLYWMDIRRGRILRAGPSATVDLPPVPEPVASASRAQGTHVPVPQAVVLGEGWGCVRARAWDSVDPIWHCWQAPARAPAAATPAPIAAHRVPWLMGRTLAATADRVCATVGTEARCWKWPDLLGARPAETPGREYMNTPRAAAGGSTTCVSVANGMEAMSHWRCTSDGRYGPRAIDTADQPGAVSQIVLGPWHGCIGRHGGDPQCWGRGDVGQLGFAPADRCEQRGHEIACAKAPQAIPFKPAGNLLAGDLFTCSVADGLTCWGASRDGLFGTAAACPPALARAWPTLRGTVAAPAATCSPAPVSVPGFKHARYEASVGPRGICAPVQGHVRCAGAIRTPSVNVSSLQVSPGNDASACGIAGDEVVCWGERYSPGGVPTETVMIALDPLAPAGLPVVDTPPRTDAPWSESCTIHFGCERAVTRVPVCAPGKTGRAWSALKPDGNKLRDTIVSVSGRLFLGRRAARGITLTENAAFETPDSCEPGQCCNRETRPLVVAEDGAGAAEGLRLDGVDCRGDESRMCCTAPAFGQAVIATGKLVGNYTGWSLMAPELCAARDQHKRGSKDRSDPSSTEHPALHRAP